MNIAVEVKGVVTIWRISGPLNIATIQPLVNARESLASPPGLIVDLAQVSNFDSSFLGELVALGSSGQKAKKVGRLKLLHVSEKIVRLLRATQLISCFEFFDDEEAALRSFA